jgi:hypothetical protein
MLAWSEIISAMVVILLDLKHNPSSQKAERILPEFDLTPALATVIFVLACLSGYQYRRVWKAEGARWLLWVFGVFTAAALLFLGFVPLQTGA